MDPLWGRLAARRKQTLSGSSSLAPTLQFEVAYLSGVGGTPRPPRPPDTVDICMHIRVQACSGAAPAITQDAGYRGGFPGQIS